MSTNKDKEATNTEFIAGPVHTGGEDVSIGGYENEIPTDKNPNAEYLRYLADICFEQEEYEKAIELYREAIDIAETNNLILTSILQASMANAYAKIHDFDLSAHYYLVARYSLVRQLQRDTENPLAQEDKFDRRLDILFFIIMSFLLLFADAFFNGNDFIKGNASVLPNLMLAILGIALGGYYMVYKAHKRRER